MVPYSLKRFIIGHSETSTTYLKTISFYCYEDCYDYHILSVIMIISEALTFTTYDHFKGDEFSSIGGYGMVMGT